MNVQGRERPPHRVTGKELGHPGEEHELDQEQPLQKEPGRRRPQPGRVRRPDPKRGEKHGQEARFQKERIPLKGEEGLADHRQGEVRRPQDDENRKRSEPGDQEQGADHPRRAEAAQNGVARTQPPADRGQPPVALSAVPLVDYTQVVSRGQDAFASDQTVDLCPERDEGDEIDHPEQTQERPAGQGEGRWGGFLAPQQRGQNRKAPAVPGHEPVETLGDAPEYRVGAVRPPGRPRPPPPARGVAERAKDRLCPTGSAAIGLDQHDRLLEPLLGDLGEAGPDLLGGLVVDLIAGLRAPAGHPPPAEIALAVVDEKRSLPLAVGLGHLVAAPARRP